MSWLNNSLNSIKGQLTTLAQEVLAETAGPGDEEYVTKTLDAKSALEDLSEAQKECDQLNKICVEKDNEIAILRKQIFEFQNKISDSGGGNVTATSNSGRTSKSPTTEPNVTTLEDSWCWEPENVKSDNDHSSETSSANGAEMVNISLDEVPLEGEKSRAQKRRKQRQSPEHTVELQKRVQQLEEENKQLNIAIDELDAQHNLAIQNVLELKKNLQDKLNAVNIDYAALKKEHADKFINGELELGKLKKQFEALQQEAKAAETQKSELQQKQDNYAAELKQAMFELADLQALLDKKDKDNIELIERIKAANKTNENAEEKYYELQQQVEKLNRELDEAKVVKEKKNSESSGSSGKQSDDEFIVVRDGDGASSGPTTPPTKEELKDKIVQLENKLSELTLENGSISLKLHDSEMEKQLSANVLKEQLLELQQKFDEKDTALAALNEELVEQREKIEQLKEQAADGIIASEKLKILSEEKELIQTEIIKLKELLRKSAELEKRLLISEQEKETLQLEMHTHRSAPERVQELEQKLQSVTLEHQQLKLNAEAETEVLNNSAELQDKLRGIAEENEIMRLELNAMTQRKFVEKKKVTDLDADEEDESTAAFDYDKLKDLLAKYYKQDSETADNVELSADEMTERTFKTLRERLWQIDALEKSLAQISEELLDLQDNKLVWDHEKKTLEADISQYVLQCDELVKNNEILLNEMDNFKRSKLETIPENNEENLLQLETQLEECAKLNRTLEEEYSELNEKIDELEREKQELTEKLRATQTENEQLQAKERDYLLQIETIELEKCNLQFELNELRSNEERNGEANVSLQLAEDKCDGLESQLERLSKDHADLVAAMQAQKASLMEAHKKRDELEKILREHELLASRNQQQIMEMQAHHATYEKALEELMLQLKLKDEALSTQQTDLANTTELRTQVVQLQKELETKRIAAENLKSQLNAQQDITATTHEMNESNTKLQSDYTELQQQLSTLQAELQNRIVSEEKLQAELKTLQVQSMQSAEKDVLTAEHQQLQELFTAQTAELKYLQAAASQLPDQDSLSHIARLEAELLSTADLQKSVDSLNYEKNEMIKALQQKHAENMQYYLEIQRLQSIIQQLQQQLVATANADKPCIKCPDFQSKLDEMRKEHEKLLDQINFLKEKSDILTTNLLTEQTNQRLIQKEKAEVLEQNAAVQKDLERLREHLLEIEDMHTQETVDMQRDLDETKAKMIAMQTEVSMSSTAYTSASIRANQHAETLQAQYALVVQQRDELVAKLSLAEDRESKNQAALCNLQCALEQFQNDKENDIKGATLRIRRDLQQELDKAEQLRNEIVILNQQLADANQGIRAASRLSDQLEACQLTIAALREEVDTMKSQNQVTEQKLQYSESSQTDKIDKNLIKSLLIGYVVSGNPNDKTQVLRMISSVLDFTQNESDKVGLNKQQSSWFGAILGNGGGSGAAGTHSKDNLVQAFVAFLEQESQPQSSASNMPNLLNMTQATSSAISTTAGSGGTASRRTSISSNSGGLSATAPMPMQLLNSNVIDEFAPSRNSSSILKDILSDT